MAHARDVDARIGLPQRGLSHTRHVRAVPAPAAPAPNQKPLQNPNVFVLSKALHISGYAFLWTHVINNMGATVNFRLLV